MTEEQAKVILEAEIVHHPECSIFGEALSIAIQALEKQIPKKPIFDCNFSDTLSKFYCECGNTIKVSHDVGIMDNNNAPNYCSKCGCRLDWGDEE